MTPGISRILGCSGCESGAGAQQARPFGLHQSEAPGSTPGLGPHGCRSISYSGSLPALTCMSALRHARGVTAIVNPSRSTVSRTRTAPGFWPSSTQFPEVPPL